MNTQSTSRLGVAFLGVELKFVLCNERGFHEFEPVTSSHFGGYTLGFPGNNRVSFRPNPSPLPVPGPTAKRRAGRQDTAGSSANIPPADNAPAIEIVIPEGHVVWLDRLNLKAAPFIM